MFTLTIENTKIFCLFLRTLRIVFKKYHQQLRIVFKNYHKQLFFENGPSLFCMVHDETKSTLLFVMLFKFHSLWERERERESTPCRPDWCWSNMQRWRNVGNGSLRYPSNICTVSGLAAIMCMASYIPRCWPFNSLAIRQSISSAMRFAFFYYNYAVPGMHVTLWACVIIV